MIKNFQLEVFLFSYCTTVHRVTGCPSAKLFFDRELPPLFDKLKPDHINDIENLNQKFYHDKRCGQRDLDVSDKVWL